MNDNFGEIFCSFFQKRIPLLFSLLLVIMFCMPLDFFEMSGLRPQISIICTYYWIQKRPQAFGLVSAFVLGLIVDMCSTTPLGINCLLLMLFSFTLNKIFYYIKPASFLIDWLLFSLSLGLVLLIKWLVLICYFQKYINANTALLNGFSTIMFYPLIAWLSDLVRKNLLPQERINE